jgi:KUP system potassium uptake protein
MPGVNWVLYVGCAVLILAFGSASKLAHAYGFAVSGVMLSTSIAMICIARILWEWRTWTAIAVFGSFALIEGMFFVANSVKFIHGGYLPLLIGGFLFLVMTTWRWGRNLMNTAYASYTARKRMSWVVELKDRLAVGGHVISDYGRRLVESDRTAIFMISRPVTSLDDGVPVTLRDYLKREGAIPEYVVLLHVKHERTARVEHEHRYRTIALGGKIHAVVAAFGFMEYPSVPTILSDLNQMRLIPDHDLCQSTIEIGQEELIVDRDATEWFKMRARAFRFLLRHATPAHHYYGLRGCPTLLTNTIPIRLADDGVDIQLFDYDRIVDCSASTK